MTEQHYRCSVAVQTKHLNNALRLRCFRTAHARIREIAKLKSDYEGIPYNDALREVESQFRISEHKK